MTAAFNLVLWRKANEILSTDPDITYWDMADRIGCTYGVAQGICIDWRIMKGLKGRRHPRGGVRKEIKKSRSEINAKYYQTQKIKEA